MRQLLHILVVSGASLFVGCVKKDTPVATDPVSSTVPSAPPAQTAPLDVLCAKVVDHLIALMRKDANLNATADAFANERPEAIAECQKEATRDTLECMLVAQSVDQALGCEKKDAAGATASEEAKKAAEEAAHTVNDADADALCNKAIDHIVAILSKDPSVPPEAKVSMKEQAADPVKRADSISKCKQDDPETVECMLAAADMAGMMACQAKKAGTEAPPPN